MDLKDKLPLQSKKFIAFFTSQAAIVGILITALVLQPFGWPMVSFMTAGIVGLCCLNLGYVIKQSAIDKFTNGLKGIVNVRQNDNIEPLE